jgi:hypothetical protein
MMARLWERKTCRHRLTTFPASHPTTTRRSSYWGGLKSTGNQRLFAHHRFTLTRHFGDGGLSQTAKPGKVFSLYREIIRCWIDAKARVTR